MDLKKLIRKNILSLQPYSSARDEFEGNAAVWLDANENPFPATYNRYPDPHQKALKEKISRLKKTPADSIFLGNGSDEAIDILIRIFCEPRVHEVLIPQPTYGMYGVSAAIHDVQIIASPLDKNFDIDCEDILKKSTDNTRLLFLCSPNNPTGNLLSKDKVIRLLKKFRGIVAVDEAYIDFANDEGFLSLLPHYKNLVVLQTFSKALGMAALRLGAAYADPFIIAMMNKTKPPYNINEFTQQRGLQKLKERKTTAEFVKTIIKERERVAAALDKLPAVKKIYPSDANFILVKIENANDVYRRLAEQGVIVRNRSSAKGCKDCLRITIGAESENNKLLKALR